LWQLSCIVSTALPCDAIAQAPILPLPTVAKRWRAGR
jgi:hypothetical protein